MILWDIEMFLKKIKLFRDHSIEDKAQDFTTKLSHGFTCKDTSM